MELLLAERPPTARDVVDLARGAVDARLDPQLSGDPARPATPWTHRLPGPLAIAGGVLWIAGFSIFATGGASDAQGWAAILLMVMSLPGGYLGAYGRQIGWGVGAAILSVALVYLLPWELKVLPTLVGISIVGGGILALAAIRAGIAARSRMLLVAITVILACLLAIPTAMGLAQFSSPLFALVLFLPFGIAWILAGLRLSIRGPVTLGEFKHA